MRVIGLDVHRSFAQVAELENGVLRQCGRVDLVRDKVLAFARTLRPDDEVVLEATGNTMAIVKLLKPHVGRVVIANPLQVRVIAEAKAKTDRIDAAALARLHAAGYLPEVWQPDEATELLRNLVSRRATIVQGMTRTKNRIHAVLHANLIPPFSGKLFLGPGGSGWLNSHWPNTNERRWTAGWQGWTPWSGADGSRDGDRFRLPRRRPGAAADDDRRHQHGGRRRRAVRDRRCPAVRLGGEAGQLLWALTRAFGSRGIDAAQHGRISKQGARMHADAGGGSLGSSVTPGPLRAFYVRVQGRKGKQVAAVATARKIAVLAWHLLTKEEDYAFARPALVAMKERQMQLKAVPNRVVAGTRPERRATTASRSCAKRNARWCSRRSRPTRALSAPGRRSRNRTSTRSPGTTRRERASRTPGRADGTAARSRLVQRIRAVDLGAVLGREVHVGQHVGLGVIHQGGELGHPRAHWSATSRHCLRAASASSWAKAVPIQAETMRRCVLPAWAMALRMKWTRQRCQSRSAPIDGGLQPLMRVGDHQLDAAQAAPGQAAQELDPERSRPRCAPTVMPSTSRRPSVLTPTATMTATETMWWSRRALT